MFFGEGKCNCKPIINEYPGIENPDDLYYCLRRCWSNETCAPRLRNKWSVKNMTLGQCSITAFLAQDIFGGKVYGIERPNGSIHCYNIVNEYVFDLTSEQFGDEKLDYSVGTEQFRNTEHHFGNGEKELMNMTEMNVFHRVIQEYMDQHSQKGLFPVLNGTTIGGNRTIAELKAQNAMEETLAATRNAKEIKEAADQSVVDANEQVKQVQSEILNMKESKLIAEEDREKWLEELEKKELPALKELKDGLRDLGGG